MSNSLKQVATKGVLWSSIERFSVQGIQFVIMIIMARLLTPEDYGLVGMLTIFLAVSQSLIDSGFSQALIRKQNRTEVDNSTVFYFNIAVGLALYLLFYISAPWVADFYGLPELSLVMRVVCLGIIFNSLAVVQRALLTVRIDFKTQAKASLIAAVISGMAGIILAYTGFGIWALVCQQLVNLGINTLLLWIFSKWKPMRTYSWKSFRELFSFGSKLLASGLLDTTYNNIYPIVIGKVFSAGDLGHYTRAQQFSVFPSSNITGILQRVTYPVLCSIQNDIDRLRGVYRKFLKLSAYVVFPLMTGLAAVSFPFIRIVLGEKWIFCAVLLQIICFSMMWYPIPVTGTGTFRSFPSVGNYQEGDRSQHPLPDHSSRSENHVLWGSGKLPSLPGNQYLLYRKADTSRFYHADARFVSHSGGFLADVCPCVFPSVDD